MLVTITQSVTTIPFSFTFTIQVGKLIQQVYDRNYRDSIFVFFPYLEEDFL